MEEGAAAEVAEDASDVKHEEGETSEGNEDKHEEGDAFGLLLHSVFGFVTFVRCLVLCFIIGCGEITSIAPNEFIIFFASSKVEEILKSRAQATDKVEPSGVLKKNIPLANSTFKNGVQNSSGGKHILRASMVWT